MFYNSLYLKIKFFYKDLIKTKHIITYSDINGPFTNVKCLMNIMAH